MDRPDEPWIRGGCDGRNANLVFDDEAAPASAERHCQSGTAYAPPGGRFTPNEPLSTFYGTPAGGTWEVTTGDAVLAYKGEIEMLCLLPGTFDEMSDVIFANGFDR